MSSQPVSGDNWAVVGTGVGTNVVSAGPSVLKKVVIPGTYVGTLNIHDSASASGTTGTSQILSLGLPATVLAQNINLEVNCRYGIVYQATGTPKAVITWE